MIKKLKCWLIHILGGYTGEECKAAREPWHKLALEFYNKYNTEHENYLAMLSLHNTTVEQMQQNASGVSGAIDTIKAYCKSKDSCDECALYDEKRGCKIHEIPCYWGE